MWAIWLDGPKCSGYQLTYTSWTLRCGSITFTVNKLYILTQVTLISIIKIVIDLITFLLLR